MRYVLSLMMSWRQFASSKMIFNLTMSNLALRAVTALLGAALIISAIVFSSWTFALVIAAIMVLSLHEFYQLARQSGRSPFEFWGQGFAIMMFLLFYAYFQFELAERFFWLLPPFLSVAFIYPLYANNRSHAINCLAITLLGVVYIALPMSLFTAIAFLDGTYQFVFVVGILFLQWANDTGAYFVGKAIGKVKLFERVSPNKTWEGCIGGGLLALVFAFGFSQYFEVISVWAWLGLGAIVAIFGTLGDLTESLFKRTLAIKDSGKAIPGHGGFLDRFDGLLLSLPFTTAYLHFITS